MKTYISPINQKPNSQSITTEKLISATLASVRDILALVSAVLAGAAVITLFVLLAGTDITPFLGAATWGIGFIFLALALENNGPAALSQVASGVALLILSLLQSSVSPDFIIVSGGVLAIWAGALLFKRLSL